MRECTDLAALHAFGFLVLGNAIGLLLGAMLLAPRLGDVLAPLSYGRWMPVHLDVHLYGWASLPLVAMLLHAYLRGPGPGALARLAVHAWSAMVVVGATSWLAGASTGKPFLEWNGGALAFLVGAMSVLSLALVVAFARAPRDWSDPMTWTRAILLAGLLPVPAVLAWAASPDVYPSINPDSGGPTGVSLMGSVLGIVALLMLTPFLLGLRPRRARTAWLVLALLAAHCAAFGLLDHGDASHHEPAQVAALASVSLWIPALVAYVREFPWPRACGVWLASSLAWGVALVISGFVSFLPGILERWKFTHALVAHAHVALAGLVTSWNLVILAVLAREAPLARALSAARWTRLWNGGLVLHLAALAGLAALEASSPGGLLPATPTASALLGTRLVGGAAQLAASAAWMAAAWASVRLPARATSAASCPTERAA